MSGFPREGAVAGPSVSWRARAGRGPPSGARGRGRRRRGRRSRCPAGCLVVGVFALPFEQIVVGCGAADPAGRGWCARLVGDGLVRCGPLPGRRLVTAAQGPERTRRFAGLAVSWPVRDERCAIRWWAATCRRELGRGRGFTGRRAGGAVSCRGGSGDALRWRLRSPRWRRVGSSAGSPRWPSCLVCGGGVPGVVWVQARDGPLASVTDFRGGPAG